MAQIKKEGRSRGLVVIDAEEREKNMQKQLIKGNEAVVKAALLVDCRT
ncbi:MAG: hypothetical protein ONB42_03925 [candidate division KSB1 bacterium]|nr:hypothetical protein [candidate division KSB1 bacterium]